jgi:hypothetical protein
MLPDARQKDMWIVLRRLADRIARNREIAGFHYPSDSRAGADLALAIFDTLKDLPKFAAAMTAARAEWADQPVQAGQRVEVNKIVSGVVTLAPQLNSNTVGLG